ncbi:hypothetical protein DY000_02013094 [Brassica cretica]|uniref:Glycoside hydrolase family 19 catalytic domain-containing protein n=1 Tax=Brassica cretica TaxID=69181 RepID=A0ABQ7D2Z0_BRACR|nr:hypothetical protein DY000_02013094 [Brassica cretica]
MTRAQYELASSMDDIVSSHSLARTIWTGLKQEHDGRRNWLTCSKGEKLVRWIGQGELSEVVIEERTSQFGSCGTNDAYCGAGCRGCAGKTFYTHDSFINAANTFPNFGNSVTRREIATMFAHYSQGTGHFCYIQAINGTLRRDACQEPQRQISCHPPGIGYFVRGERLNIDLLRQPELVRSNPTLGFKTSLLFWMNSVRPVLNQGFGATIRAINGTECNGGNLVAVNERIRYYRDYCGQLGVDPGSNLSC